MARSDTDTDTKVFDVAKPEDAKLDVGSKPMVIGHKTLASDPIIREATQASAVTVVEDEEQSALATTKKVIIEPLNQESVLAQTEKTDVASSNGMQNKSEADLKAEDEQMAQDFIADQEAVVEELIKSKKYTVRIKEQRQFSFVAAFKLLLVLMLTAIVALAALLYTDIIESPVSLPFMESKSDTNDNSAQNDENQNTNQSIVVPQTQSVPEVYSMNTPSSWVKVQKLGSLDGTTLFTDTYTLSSGTTVTIAQDNGGRGGSCEPEPNDVPHQVGNNCPTLELLEKTAIDSPDERTGDSTVYVTKQRFTDIDGESIYSLCLLSYENDGFNPEVGEPFMGYIFEGCGSGITIMGNPYIIVTIKGIDSSTEDYFDDPDSIAIREALLTFKLL